MRPTICSLTILFIFLCISPSSFAQENEEVEKLNARLSLVFVNDNSSPKLVSEVKARIDRVYVGMENVKVDFYIGEISEGTYIGSQTTNENGVANFSIPEEMGPILDTMAVYSFAAAITDDSQVNDDEEFIEVVRSKIELILEEIDSIKTIKFFVGRYNGEGISPVEDVEGGIFIKRLFGLLPLVEYEYTDSEGFIYAEFPEDLKGDRMGNVTIVGKAEDTDEFGTLIASETIAWGLPLEVIDYSEVRELWSPAENAPLYLVITVSVMVLGIWGCIAYLIRQVLKIRRLGRA